MTLKIYNNLTKVSYTLENLVDLRQSSINYCFNITLPEGIDNGEYNYTLTDDEDNVAATGILQIGSYAPQKQAYTAQTNNGFVLYNG